MTFLGRKNILISWIRTILLLMAVYIALSFILHGTAANLIEEQITAINAGLAAQIRNRIDNQLTETRAIGVEVGNAPYAAALAASPLKDVAEYSWAYRDMVEYFRVTEATHSFIESLVIMYPRDGIVITSDGLFRLYDYGIPSDTRDFILQEGDRILKRPGWDRFDWISDSAGNFFYIQTLPGADTAGTPILLVLVDKSYESGSLGAIPTRYGGIQFVTDEDGSVLFSSGNTAGDGVPEDFIQRLPVESWSGIIENAGAAAVVQSEIGDLYCCSFIPEDLFMSEFKRMKRIFLFISSAAVTICFILIVYFFFVHYRPLKKIIHGLEDSLDSSARKGNEYERLEMYSTRLMTANKISRNQLQQFEENMDNQYYEKLLKGLLSYRQLPGHLRNLESPSPSGAFVLAFIRISGSDFPSEVIHLYTSELVSGLPAGWTSHREVFIDDAVVFILSAAAPRENTDTLLAYLETHSTAMKRQTGYVPLAVVGTPFTSVTEIHDRYLACRRRMEEAEFFLQEQAVLVDEDEPQDFLYLRQEEQKFLADAVREGSSEKAVQWTAKIMDRIASSGITSTGTARCLLFSTLTAVIQTVSGTPAGREEFMCGYNELLADFFRAEDIQSMRASLDEIVARSCEEIARRRKDHRKRLFEEIKRYVEKNLSDSEMYLPSIAGHFGLNPKYLTVFFKEHQGTALAEYIRQTRVEKACSLILEGRPVKEAAESAGFSNIISFNRVFKKMKNMTPTEFRREAVMRKEY